jgi:hypothetical protein
VSWMSSTLASLPRIRCSTAHQPVSCSMLTVLNSWLAVMGMCLSSLLAPHPFIQTLTSRRTFQTSNNYTASYIMDVSPSSPGSILATIPDLTGIDQVACMSQTVKPRPRSLSNALQTILSQTSTTSPPPPIFSTTVHQPASSVLWMRGVDSWSRVYRRIIRRRTLSPRIR